MDHEPAAAKRSRAAQPCRGAGGHEPMHDSYGLKEYRMYTVCAL